jgi:WD40 repeat protein
MYTLKGHTADVNNVQFHRDCKKLLTGSFDKQLGLWDLRSGKLIEFLQGHDGEVIKCSFDFLGDKVLRQTTEPLATFTDNTDEVRVCIMLIRHNLQENQVHHSKEC